MQLWTRPLVVKSALMGIISFFSLHHHHQRLRVIKNDQQQQQLQLQHPLVRKHFEGRNDIQTMDPAMSVAVTKSAAATATSSEESVVSTTTSSSTSSTTMTTMIPRVASYHKPPPGQGVDYYQNNPTVFGQILRGEIPTAVVAETDDLLMFQDIHPRAPMHDLIIPKQYIPNVFELVDPNSSLPLLYEMRDLAFQKLQQEQPVALEGKDYRLVFHVPPFNSVDHLHLHVLAPASQMTMFHRLFKYSPRDYRWCVSLETVITRLQEGKTAVPWTRNNNTYSGTIARRKHQSSLQVNVDSV